MLHSVCQQIWKSWQWPQDWENVDFHSIPISKKGNAKDCSNYHAVVLISHASKVMLKILQAGFSSMWTKTFQMYKLGLEKAEESNCQHLWDHWESKGIPENIYFCFIDYTKPLAVWITINCGKFLRDGNTRSLFLSPENPVCKSRSNS